MADKIQVAVRVRPVLFQKKDVEVHWACSKGMVFQVDPSNKKRIGNPYLFDQVFGTETQNNQIFTELVQPLIDSAMNGFNVTVLAYGQTASGKTYTMMGSQKELGIVQLAIERMFTLIEENPERAFLLRCSYIEIYNETISDLLSSNHQKLKVQELAEGHVVVHNLIETNVNTPDAVLKLMQQGNKQRKVGGTSMNERSSRSHTIFRIIVESVPRDEADRSDAAVIVSHINLVDLAGSEKASQTNATGDRFREGCAINTSLSALSLVIKQLSEGEGFVNFRDSKLTHILRASLGGNARTAIICNVTPTVLDETSSTLKFACSAKAVQNQPHVNEVLSDQALLRKYNNYIKDLEKKLKEKELEKRPEAIEEMQRLLQEKDMKINELKEQLVVSSSEVIVRPDDPLTCAQRTLRRMTWGGNRLKQLSFPGPGIFESTPLFPRIGSSRQRINTFSNSEMTLDELGGDSDSIESESFLPAELVFSKMSDPVAKIDVATMTDVSLTPFKFPNAPCTPVPVLRERTTRLQMNLVKRDKEIQDLRDELEDLTNFTRLEQEIGVHHQVTAKNADSAESADQLHKALQTANDMEVLYLDTQRKFSELQTEFRNKEVEHETTFQSQQRDFQQRLDSEIIEKKRLAKELNELKEKHNRLERDQAEADTHVQVINERHAKREADLRHTLQEAWSQLEALGQNPNVIQDNATAKQQLAVIEKELSEMTTRNTEAQFKIDSLTEELRQFKEAVRQAPETISKDDRMLDDSLSGMCLADELRDVMSSECSFVSRTLPRTRKRPSSILSVALAKMDQSTSILDYIDQEVEPVKKTRLSIQSSPSGDEVKELKEIREYLVQLQTVLVRYEEDFEILSQEKEDLCNQLLSAQSEIESLRVNKPNPDTSLQRSLQKSPKEAEQSIKKTDISTSDEIFDSSCFMGEPSMSASLMDMEHSVDSDDHYVSCGSPTVAEDAEAAAAALRMQKDEANRRKQEIEDQLSDMTDKIMALQNEVETKSAALEESLKSLQAAQSTIEEMERRDNDKEQLILNLNQSNEQIVSIQEASNAVSKELEVTRQSLEESQAKILELSNAKILVESQLENVSQELNSIRQELQVTLERVVDNKEIPSTACVELDQALERVKTLEAELDTQKNETNVAQCALQEAASRMETYTKTCDDLSQARDRVKTLEIELQLKQNELDAAQTAMQEVCSREEAYTKTCDDLNQALERVKMLETELETKKTEADAVQCVVLEASSRVEKLEQILFEKIKLQELVDKLSNEYKELEESLDLKSKELVAAQEASKEVYDNCKANFDVELEKKQSELNEALEKLSEIGAEYDTAQLQIESVRNDLQENSTRIQELHRRTEQLEAEKKEIMVLKEELEAELRVKSDALERIQACKETETSFNSSEIDRLQLSLQEAQAQAKQLHQSNEELLTELSQAKTRIDELAVEQSKTASLLAANEETQSKVQALTEDLESKKENIQQLQSNLNESESRFKELQSVNEEIQNELKNATRRVQDFEENLESELDARLAIQRVAEEAANKAAEMAKEATAEREQFQRELVEVRDRATELSQKLEESSAALEAAKSEIRALEQTFNATRVPKEDLLALECEWKEAMLKVSQLETSLEEKTNQLNVSRQALEVTQAQVQALEKAEQSSSNQAMDLQRTVEELSSKNNELNSFIEQIKFELQSKEEEIVNLRSMTERVSALESRLEISNNEVEKLSRVIEEKREALQLLEEELSRAKDGQHSRQEQLQHIEQKFRERQNELEGVRASLDAMQSANDDLVAQLNDKENTNVDLRRNLDSTSQRFDILHAKLEAVQSEKSDLIERVRILEVEADVRMNEIRNLNETRMFGEIERESLAQLKLRFQSLQAQYDETVSQCKQLLKLRDELLENQEQSQNEILTMNSQLQSLSEAKVELEQKLLDYEKQKAAIQQGYDQIQTTLTETENELKVSQSQREEYLNVVKVLNEQLSEIRAKATVMESSSNHQLHHHMEETIEQLKRDLVDARSKGEVLRLNFETEEDSRKKKIERLEKELDSVKQQYIKCKEQLRLSRYRPNEEVTISLPKHRVSVSTESSYSQTDPIADKGFGFRWQMEQYVSDNERLRKKVSEVGERMEFYKEKLIKYRNLYFQSTGQDSNQRPLSSSSNSSQPSERHSSTSSTSRENGLAIPNIDLDRNPKGKYLSPNAVFPSVSPQPVVTTLQEHQQKDEASNLVSTKTVTPLGRTLTAGTTATSASSSARWSGNSGVKKETLTKEEMEKINNCNTS